MQDPKSLIPYKNNNKIHSEEQILRLAASIQEYGFDQAIVVDKNNVIIKGDGRRSASIKLNLPLVPTIIREDLTENQVRASRIADNKSSSNEYNNDAIKFDLGLLNSQEFNLALTAIQPLELEQLMKDNFIDDDFQKSIIGEFQNTGANAPNPIVGEVRNVTPEFVQGEDEVPEEFPTIAKLGNIFKLGDHRLMCGDSTNKDIIEKLMNGEKADFIFTDPPYGMNLDTDYSNLPSAPNGARPKKDFKKVAGDNEDFKPELITTILNNFSYVKEVFIFGADYFAEIIPNKNKGSWVVWDKRVTENFDRMIGSAFELCWSKSKHKREIARFNNTLFSGESDAKNKVHPTQKPIKLIEWFLLKWGSESRLVIDLYGGSGSTMIACEKQSKKCYMIELDPYYVDVIIARWEKFTGLKAELIS